MTIRDLAFPFNKGSSKLPATKDDDDVIADHVRRILLTRRGERVMRPNAGSDVMGFVFESIGPMLRARIGFEVRRALAAGEPRLEVLGVQVAQQQNRQVRGYTLVVTVTYRLRGELKNTVVPLSSRGRAA
jgi:phage baseplate assembly protein W